MSVQSAVRHKHRGIYFGDFTPGELVEHRYHRTVTQMDNMPLGSARPSSVSSAHAQPERQVRRRMPLPGVHGEAAEVIAHAR
jgi:hypothetical protein